MTSDQREKLETFLLEVVNCRTEIGRGPAQSYERRIVAAQALATLELADATRRTEVEP